MAVSLGEAVLKIGVNHSSYEKKLGQLKGLAKKQLDGAASQVLASTKSVLIAGAGAIAAGVAAVLDSVNFTAKYADDMDEMAKRTGMTTQKLSELKYIADLTGSSIEGVETAIKKMQKSIYGKSDEGDEEKKQEAILRIQRNIRNAQERYQAQMEKNRKGTFVGGQFRYEDSEEDAKAFRDLNEEIADQAKALRDLTAEEDAAKSAFDELRLSQEELKKLSPEKQFDAITENLADIPDASKRAALAMAVFGKSGTSMLPMLAEGRAGLAKMKQEAIDSGMVMTDAQAAATKDMADNMTRLKVSFDGVRIAIGSQLIPVVEKYVLQARDWVNAHRELIAGKVEEYLQRIVAAAKEYWPQIKEAATWIFNGLVWLKDHAKQLAIIYGSVVALSAVWKAATAAVTAYKVASTLITVGKNAMLEKGLKGAAEAAGKGAAGKAAASTVAGAAVSKAAMVVAPVAGAVAGGVAGKVAFDAGLANKGTALGALLGGGGRAMSATDEELAATNTGDNGGFWNGVRRGARKLGAVAVNPIGAAAGYLGTLGNKPTTQLGERSKEIQASQTTMHIQNVNVNAADVMTERKFEETILRKAGKVMP